MSGRRVVVIGAGFGGISTAALLARDGWDVTVVEKNGQAGGRGMVYRDHGFTFDMGPSWYLMPDIFERFFAELGGAPSDYYQLQRLDPAYRIFFGPGDAVDISPDLEENLALFERHETGGAAKLRKYLDQAEYQYRVSVDHFIYRDFRSVFDFFNLRMMVEGARLKVFQKMDRFVAGFFDSERLRKILQYNLVFLGGTPKNTPAIYALMAHVDFNLGVWYPVGGMGSVVDGLVRAAEEQGVRFHYDRPVRRIIVRGGKAVGVETDEGNIDADLVVANADYHHVEQMLLAPNERNYSERYWKTRTMAPSALMLYLGVEGRVDNLAHHNLFLDNDWVRHFDAIFDQPAWPQSPSYYVCAPSITDPSVSPDGSENLFVLLPVASGLEDPDEIRDKYAEQLITHLEGLTGASIGSRLQVKRVFSQRDFTSVFNAFQGTALGLSHTMRQTANFRPANRSRKVDNLYFTGHYIHPGIGVPMTLIGAHVVRDVIRRRHGAVVSPSGPVE